MKFGNTVLDILDKSAPLKRRTVRGRQANWYTPEIKKLCNDRNRKMKLAVSSRSSNVGIAYQQA